MADDRAGVEPADETPRVGDAVPDGDPAAQADDGGPGSTRRWPRVLLLLLALAIGAGAGWAGRAATAPTSAPPPTAPVVSAPTPAPGVPCPAAADAGAAIRAQIDRAVGAVRDFDPRALQDVLDEVQVQQARLEAAVTACRTVAAPS